MTGSDVRPLLPTLTFQARTYDIDFAGIVSNIVYVRWQEDLRGEMLAAHYPAERIQACPCPGKLGHQGQRIC